MIKLASFFMLISLSIACITKGNEIVLINNNASQYALVIPGKPTLAEEKAAKILQAYFKKITGVTLPIEKEMGFRGSPGIYIGNTYRTEKFNSGKLKPEAFMIATDNHHVFIKGGAGKGVVYGVYTLLDKYFGCKKMANEPAIVPIQKKLSIQSGIMDVQVPNLVYRQVYYPQSTDPEYLEWHKLHLLDDLWGLWGHSLYKIIPPNVYFKTHPEYFALVNGVRNPSQLDLSNESVFKLTVAYFKKAIAENPDALYWSLSINDDVVYSTSPANIAIDAEEGGPTGSIIRFVNRVANEFPNQTFTTLAYLYASKPPLRTKPAPNVIPFLSCIDAYRQTPLEKEGSAAAFRKNLQGWSKISSQVFVWDYTTQFTNYLAPFPDVNTLQPNMQYFVANNVKGVFAQGTGDIANGDFAALKCYLQAQLMWNAQVNIDSTTQLFCKNYYGNATPFVLSYKQLLEQTRASSNRKLDIYGNPINEWKTYLSPENIELYSAILDKAEAAVEPNKLLLAHVQQLRLSLEYTVLQQSKFYGIEKHGYLEKNRDGQYTVKQNWPIRIKKFTDNCVAFGVKELSEAGTTPAAYLKEWTEIFAKKYTPNLALNALVQLQYPPLEDYPAKGNRTLVDGVEGYTDFSYNYLHFYGQDMVATIDMGKPIKGKTVSINFLDDPRHWIFEPASISVAYSIDGVNFTTFGNYTNKELNIGEEYYAVIKKRQVFNLPNNIAIRYVKVIASPISSLPNWRFRQGRKAAICCDEIWVH